jgi:hypothetical protein
VVIAGEEGATMEWTEVQYINKCQQVCFEDEVGLSLHRRPSESTPPASHYPHIFSMGEKPDPAFTQVERNIRALTVAIQLVLPNHAPSGTPVASASMDNTALSKAYNHIAILLTLEAEGGAGRQLEVVAVTGKVTDSRLSVCALSNITLTQNPSSKDVV